MEKKVVEIPLHILHLEDSPDDMELVRSLLNKEGIDCEIINVRSREDFHASLERDEYDLILADFPLSSFDGLSALVIAKKICPNVPFIIISSVLGEEIAIDCLKAGATDYILKDRMYRLVPAISRALHGAEERLEREYAQKALQESEERYRDLYENAPSAYLSISPVDGKILHCNTAALRLFGYDMETMMTLKIFILNGNSPQGLSRFQEIFRLLKTNHSIKDVELQVTHKDGYPVWISLSAESIKDAGGNIIENRFMMTDITARKKAEEALRRSEEKYRDLYESNKDGIITCDIEGSIIDVNQAYLDMLGYSKEEIRRLNIQQLTPSRWHREENNILRKQIMTRGYSDEYEKEYVKKDGTVFPVSMRLWLIKDGTGKSSGMWGIARDITERKRLEEKLHKLSILDELTKLYNRRGFFALGEQQWKVAKRTNKVMNLLFADLDDMKVINDTMGHGAGDQALKETADVLKKTFRESDIIARIGGDEFVVLSMQEKEDDKGNLINRLQRNLERLNNSKGQKYKLSLSLGMANSDTKDPRSLLELLSLADKHMYEQKGRKEKLY